MSKDASCQTSDVEIFPRKSGEREKMSSRTSSVERKHRFYDHRRATDSVLSDKPRTEGKLFTVCCLMNILCY